MKGVIFITFALSLFGVVAQAQLPSELPTKSRKIYAKSADERVSDESNGENIDWLEIDLLE